MRSRPCWCPSPKRLWLGGLLAITVAALTATVLLEVHAPGLDSKAEIEDSSSVASATSTDATRATLTVPVHRQGVDVRPDTAASMAEPGPVFTGRCVGAND